MESSASDHANVAEKNTADCQSFCAPERQSSPMELVPCPLCGGAEHKLLFERLDHTHYITNDRFRIVRCRNCSMAFVNPRPGPKNIELFYPPEFYDVGVEPSSC